ncbi:MAG: type II toxin-antitoxin system VapC family toxin, partial [Sphingomicrobium sp.]
VSSLVLDASALLALMNDEPGSEVVAQVVEGSSMNAVNVAEVISKLVERGLESGDVHASIDGFGIVMHDFTIADAVVTGDLRHSTRRLGLSLGDRACIATAQRLGGTVLTADSAWGRGALPVTVKLIR